PQAVVEATCSARTIRTGAALTSSARITWVDVHTYTRIAPITMAANPITATPRLITISRFITDGPTIRGLPLFITIGVGTPNPGTATTVRTTPRILLTLPLPFGLPTT